jgi:hypothetical protein
MEKVEMPDRLADDLLLFIRQNKGTLSKKHREREFEALKDDEVTAIEAVVREAFDGFEDEAVKHNAECEGYLSNDEAFDKERAGNVTA